MHRRDPGVEAAAQAFGRSIRDARARRGLSQAALGERSGLAQSTVSKLETGALRGMRYATLMRVLGALDVTAVRIDVQRSGWYADLLARYTGEGYDREGDEPGDALRYRMIAGSRGVSPRRSA